MSTFLMKMTDPVAGPAMYRLAEAIADSQLIPPHLRGKVSDVFVALGMADQLGENPIVVLQNIYIVSGRAGWSASYMVARARRCGVFSGPIDWRVAKGAKGEVLGATAFATLAGSDREVSMEVSMLMAEAEGWTKNPKYKTMPEVMLRYRAATLLIRMYAPEIMLGLPVDDEIVDTEASVVSSRVVAPARGTKALTEAAREPTAPQADRATSIVLDLDEDGGL